MRRFVPRAIRAGLAAPTRPYGYVVRDFSLPHDPGVAFLHAPECELLARKSVHDEAWDRGICDFVDLIASEHTYVVDDPAAAERAHRRVFSEYDFPIRPHSCVAVQQEWLAGLVTVDELGAELRLAEEDMDELWWRFVAAAYEPGLMFVNHRRDGQWLVDPQIANSIRAHVAAHPREYHRLPAPVDPAS